MEQYEYRNGPPAPRMVAELAMRHDALVKQLADAQATIAALQARVQELEDDRSAWKEIAQDWSAAAKLAEQPEKFYEGYSAAVMNAMQALLTKARAGFTQRTAELEAAKQWKLQLCNLTPGGSEFADDPAYCAEWVRKSRENQHNVILDKYREAKALKAELERVRAELATYKETKHDAI